jgi:hypothetical protein
MDFIINKGFKDQAESPTRKKKAVKHDKISQNRLALTLSFRLKIIWENLVEENSLTKEIIETDLSPKAVTLKSPKNMKIRKAFQDKLSKFNVITKQASSSSRQQISQPKTPDPPNKCTSVIHINTSRLFRKSYESKSSPSQ